MYMVTSVNRQIRDRLELKLSDSFGKESDMDLRVTMLNINHGRNGNCWKPVNRSMNIPFLWIMCDNCRVRDMDLTLQWRML